VAEDYVAWTKRVSESVSIDASEVVFAATACRRGVNWDDFKGIDSRVRRWLSRRDPPVPDPVNPRARSEDLRRPRMTTMGAGLQVRDGREAGAAAVLIVHETGPAGYPFAVVQGKTPSSSIWRRRPQHGRSAIEGWITHEQAVRLFASRQDYDKLKAQAATREFKPTRWDEGLPALANRSGPSIPQCRGSLEGSDRHSRTIRIYTALGHFGIGVPVKATRSTRRGRQRSGVADVEIAKAFKICDAPKRSTLFFSSHGRKRGVGSSIAASPSPPGKTGGDQPRR